MSTFGPERGYEVRGVVPESEPGRGLPRVRAVQAQQYLRIVERLGQDRPERLATVAQRLGSHRPKPGESAIDALQFGPESYT